MLIPWRVSDFFVASDFLFFLFLVVLVLVLVVLFLVILVVFSFLGRFSQFIDICFGRRLAPLPNKAGISLLSACSSFGSPILHDRNLTSTSSKSRCFAQTSG